MPLNRLTEAMGRALARYLQTPTGRYRSYAVTPLPLLRACLRPADILLVEGDTRISAAIKYLTTSTWSHAAFYVGDPDGCDLIEADLERGVRYVSLEHYAHLNTRVCRPVGIDATDLDRVVAYMRASIGRSYDLRNVIDLARYLLPEPPVPRRWRRRMIALGSGDPTRAICSTLIAQAFQIVRYPILPEIKVDPDDPVRREILHIRDHSLFAPRDFDLSPYFANVKPTIERGFDYQALHWYDGGPGAEGVSRPSPPS
ncbi:MAG: lipo-like protein [Rhodobacteraceae bacterium]|nr:lipo-like protein [Paracoccaceae bacterium]